MPPSVLCSLLLLMLLAAHTHVAAVSTTRVKRATNCGRDRFQCRNGACISSAAVCNRVRDCPDGSDELRAACLSALGPAVSNFIEREVLRAPAVCPAGGFQCPTGQCIEGHRVCDGRKDCPAAADERLPQCRAAAPQCSTGEFQCSSGTCIPTSSVCNGVRECSDGGDEAVSLCGTPVSSVASRPVTGLWVPVPESRCLYPPAPAHGEYSVPDCESCSPTPGTPVHAGASVLLYSCDSGYELQGDNVIFCRGGKWSKSPPVCEPQCPPLATESVSADCFRGASRFTCDVPVPPGTRAVARCRLYYTSGGARKQNLVCRQDGRWSGFAMECYPACGKERSNATTLISGGTVVNGPEFPWHVAIYNNEDYKCGGSLISHKYVLSAAHCFWVEGRGGTFPVEVFRVIAGKVHRSYTVYDPGQQERAVRKIDIPETYLGSQLSYRDDLAVLTVATPFRLSESVGPVCVDWDGSKELAAGDLGRVAGFGSTETGDPTEVLLSAELPVIDYTECINSIEARHRSLFGGDKICAGYRNGTTVCRGDSGGGLTFQHDISPLGAPSRLYFVQGIVSLGVASTGGCNLQNYVAFTNVSMFISFLHKYKDATFVL